MSAKGLEHMKIMWAEMKPDVYGGDNLNEHIPRWDCFSEGDKENHISEDPIILNPKAFSPGTKIVISEPLCPKCRGFYIDCRDSNCSFNWEKWTEEQYS